jgi:phosphomannomutase
MNRDNTIVLFDVDGTLTESRKKITSDVRDIILKLKERVTIGVVGGSDFIKQKEQLGDDVLDLVDYSFPENGIISYYHGEIIHQNSIKEYLGEAKIRNFVNFCLRYFADLDIPVKRGTFIEFRTGMINLSPIGRNCSEIERVEFCLYDDKNQIRSKMIAALEAEFPDYKLKYSIGGQISIDVFPIGWDKRYCLQHLNSRKFDNIYFFGDMTDPGGNDHEIYSSNEVDGYQVQSPQDTIDKVRKIFLD